tara:strand:+ start:101 stop:643 length:543 start_codon:yes stop_codon:yes gene_type:complete
VNKSQIRKKIIKIRELANKKNIKLNFEKINSIVLSTKGLKKNIGGYFPVNFEVDDLDILQNFHTKKYQISLPVIKRNFEMNFYKWKFNEPLKVNSFGIPEPSSKSLTYPDIILVPLVAFDKNLNRLGYGGGYYDRLIEKLEKKKKVLKIGLALAEQRISNIPTNMYDKKLDHIVTNKFIL